ncbi:MAG TPA: hypothetical protein VK487_11755, partial [Candidatus Bathyarchaeia archaeon]|nr:hypothetical protein [Candidatus Bathyarchaeia archaeon]
TKGFMAYVDDVKIGRLTPLRLLRKFAEAGSENKFWSSYDSFGEFQLRFAKDKHGQEPYAGLESYGPYDLERNRRLDEVFVTIFNFSPRISGENVQTFYKDLVEGVPRRPGFVGMNRLFKINIRRFVEDVIQKDIKSSLTRLRRTPHIAIIITQLSGEKNVRQYRPFKQELTLEGIPCQFVLDRNIGPNASLSKYSGYLKNLALCIYAKLGGVPWILDHSLGDGKCFLGLAAIFRKKRVYMSLQTFDHFGQWLGGWTEQTDIRDYSQVLERRFKEALKLYEGLYGRPANVIVHKDGELLHDLEMPVLNKVTEIDSKIVSVKKLGFQRMYDTSIEDYRVNRGTYLQVSSNEAMLVTSGPPHHFQGAQKPLTIDIKNPSNPDPILIKEICKEIFQLSLVYGGYTLAITSKPITTHFASTAASLAANYEIKENPHLWKKAWFL